MEKVSALQAARLLGVTVDKLRRLEKQGVIHAMSSPEGESFYTSS